MTNKFTNLLCFFNDYKHINKYVFKIEYQTTEKKVGNNFKSGKKIMYVCNQNMWIFFLLSLK